MIKLWKSSRIKPGDIYEDCSFHPVLCTETDGRSVSGISLIDGTGPRNCSILHCGVRKLTIADALKIKEEGPDDLHVRKWIVEHNPSGVWWNQETAEDVK